MFGKVIAYLRLAIRLGQISHSEYKAILLFYSNLKLHLVTMA